MTPEARQLHKTTVFFDAILCQLNKYPQNGGPDKYEPYAFKQKEINKSLTFSYKVILGSDLHSGAYSLSLSLSQLVIPWGVVGSAFFITSGAYYITYIILGYIPGKSSPMLSISHHKKVLRSTVGSSDKNNRPR